MSDDDDIFDDIPEVEALQRMMYENVALGYAEVVGESDGDPVFRLTEKGEQHIRGQMPADPPSEDKP